MKEQYPADNRDRINAAILDSASILERDGLEAALTFAQQATDGLSHDYRYVLTEACHKLFATGDPEKQDKGLAFYAWEADQFPDHERASGIAWNAKYDVRIEGQESFARQCFGIAFRHLGNLRASNTFTPTIEYLTDVDRVLYYTDEAGFNDVARTFIVDFSASLVAYVEGQYQATEREAEYEFSIDNLLSAVVNACTDVDPDIAHKAKSLIRDEATLQVLEDSVVIKQIMNNLENGNVDLALATIKSTYNLFLFGFWGKVYDVLESGVIQTQDAMHLVDTVLGREPEYFRFESGVMPDISIGRKGGYLFGVLAREDIIDTLLPDNTEQNQIPIRVIMGIAAGLGKAGRPEIYEKLREKLLPTEGLIDALDEWFEHGRSGEKLP